MIKTLIFICITLGCAMVYSDEDPTTSICRVELKADEEFRAMVSFLEEIREVLIYWGHPIPPISMILPIIRSYLWNNGILVSDAVFDRLYAEFEDYESSQVFPDSDSLYNGTYL